MLLFAVDAYLKHEPASEIDTADLGFAIRKSESEGSRETRLHSRKGGEGEEKRA